MALPKRDSFPTVHWAAWDADATFLPGDVLPPEGSEGRLYASLVFVFYGNRIALADIAGRGLTIPSGRIGEKEDMAGAAVYLASRAGDYVVGSTLTVDGGVAWRR